MSKIDAFSLVAKLTLDSSEYDKGLDNSEKKASSFGDKLKGGLATAAKVGAAGLAAAGAAVVNLGKSAVSGFADFEQLSGGVETLFKDSADAVMQYAENAYKTAGLSANEYMETVTSFSASLLQSLDGDTAAAASVADMAISDMSDNANKMGTSMEAIQTAYQGFAKQNYTMLDNLKLGYGGTKTEMERLLADATALSGVEYDINSLSDVYEAIHVIQTELDITGTTAKEASTTISGSLGMLKSSWTNLVAGLANPDADIGALIGNMVDSAKTAAGNLLPAVSSALSGFGQLVSGLAPIISEALPVLVSDVTPALFSSALSLVETAASAILSNMGLILETGISLLMELIQGLTEALPELIPVAIDAVLLLVDTLTEPDMLSQLIDAALALTIALANGLIEALPRLLEKIPVIVENLVVALVRNAPKLLSAAFELMVTLGRGIINNLGEMAKAAGRIISTLLDGLSSLLDSFLTVGGNIVRGIWQGISNGFTWIKDKIRGWVGDVLSFFKNLLGIASPSKVFAAIGENMAQGVGVGIENGIDDVEKAVADMSNAAIGAWKADTLTTSIQGAGTYQFGATGTYGDRTNSVVVNVYGAEGQNIRELAQEVEKVITRSIQTKEAAWA